VQEMSNVLQQNTRYWEKGEYQFLSKSLTNLLEGVLETDHRPFAIKAEQWARTPGMSSSGYSLTTFLPYLDDLLDLCEPQWYYASDFQLFFDCYRSHEISRISCRDHPEIMGKQYADKRSGRTWISSPKRTVWTLEDLRARRSVTRKKAEGAFGWAALW
jgi:hypothetical protein